MSNTGGYLNSGEVFSGEFPIFRLLVVDDDTVYMKILQGMLKKCQYEVTTCDRAEAALSLLRENKKHFQLVISDVHMPDMDGFELLEQIALEMDLSVIMMSVDDSRSVVMKGAIRGAHDYLIKPVCIDALKNIWQHVVRQNKDEWNGKILDQSDEVEHSCVSSEGSSKKKTEERSDTAATLKKARTVWSPELHNKFVQAIDHLGMDRAVPKKILELMNVPWLKRENVASHLQKHRLHLRRHQSGLNDAFMGHSEATIETLSNHLQAVAPISQLPAQNLGTWGRPASKSPIFVPLADQINHFSFENPMLRYQSQQQMNNVNLLYGIPTTVEQNPSFLGLHMPVGRIPQPQLQAQNILCESNKFLSRNDIVHNARGSSSAVDFSLNQSIPLAGCNFPLSSGNSAVSDNIYNELYQQNVGSTFDASYHYTINNGILSMEQSVHNVNAPIAEAEIGRVSNPIVGPHVNAERYPGSSFPEPFGHEEDLMSALLEQVYRKTTTLPSKQQEESVGTVE